MSRVSSRLRIVLWGFLCAIGVVICDQLSKWVILTQILVPPRVLEVTSFFDLVLVFNRGVSFGFLSTAPAFSVYLLIGLTLLISLVLVIWLLRAETLILGLGLGLILGGALGNLIDRIRFSGVVDFLHFHWKDYSFPAFNLADSAITLGVVLILCEGFFIKRSS